MNTPRSTGTVALIGYRGSGKTLVGTLLARLLGGRCVDTDERIVARTGRSIADIFAVEGENRFRQYETEVIAEVTAGRPLEKETGSERERGAGPLSQPERGASSLSRPPRVISVGGGAVLNPANVDRLRQVARIVWLTAAPEVLWHRICADDKTTTSRPALTETEGLAEVRQVLAARTPLYEQAADLVVDTTAKTPNQVAAEIADWLDKPIPPRSPRCE